MVVLMDGGTGGASNIHGRQPDPLRKRRSNERHYVFDVAFGADSTQVDYIAGFCKLFEILLEILALCNPVIISNQLILGRRLFENHKAIS